MFTFHVCSKAVLDLMSQFTTVTLSCARVNVVSGMRSMILNRCLYFCLLLHSPSFYIRQFVSET